MGTQTMRPFGCKLGLGAGLRSHKNSLLLAHCRKIQGDRHFLTSIGHRVRAHPAVVAAVAPSPAQKRSTHVAQRARHRDTVSSSRQAQHSEAPQTAPNVVDRFFTGLTAAIEHARTVRHRITATLATASLNDRYLRSSKMRSRGATLAPYPFAATRLLSARCDDATAITIAAITLQIALVRIGVR